MNQPSEQPPPGSIATFAAGSQIEGSFACIRKDRLATKKGGAYLALTLRDRSGELDARVFRDADQLGTRFERGDIVAVGGRVESFRGELVAELEAIRALAPTEVDATRFLPVAYRSIPELLGFFEHLVGEVHDPGLRGLIERVCGEPTVARELRRAPCSQSSHHAYLGGLLEHTVAVGILATETVQLHPRLDSDLLMAAALLHDIGKCREFSYGAEFTISDEGALLGHLAIGAQIIEAAAAGLDRARKNQLLHCVLTHHGADSGPAKAAGGRGFASAEALALYRINALDAGVKGYLERGPRG